MTAAPTWNLACPDWVERLKAGRSPIPDLPLDKAKADKAVAIFNKLRLPDVVGQPTMAEASGEWIRDLVRVAFGSQDPETARRAIAEILALVPKKNSKTTGGAAIALTATLLNERPRAELLLVGPTQEIADLAFQQIVGMIDADEEGYLQKRFQVQEHHKTIIDRLTKARLKIKTFDMKVMTGAKPVFVLLDELHIMSAYAYASRVLGQIRGGLITNAESLLIMITTQSDEPPSGVFATELQYARDIRAGRITRGVRLLPMLFEFPEEMQTDETKPWADPIHWPMVLPNLGRSITLDRLIEEFDQAKEKGEAELRRWASQHLNVEIGMALHAARWRGADHWLKQADKTLTLKDLLRRCEVVVCGGDGGGLDDLLALAVVGREKDTHRWLIWAKAWVHAEVLELRRDIAEKLQDFDRDGDLVLCTSPTQDFEEFAAIVGEVKASGLMPAENAVGLDPAGVSHLIDALDAAGVAPEQIIGVPQGYRLNGAVLGLERKLKDGSAVHCGSRLLAWTVGNAKSVQAGNAVMITKQTSGKAKIDPLMAIFDAYQLMARNPEAPKPPTYQMLMVG